MALYSAPLASDSVIGINLASTYRLLGILVDDQLSFKPYLCEICRRGRAAFIELFHAGETAGFSIPILAGQVTCRIVPLVLFGAAILISVPKADLALNRLQSFWACSLLGCPPNFRLAAMTAAAACGWPLCLGTLVWEVAVVAFARLFLLPQDHPSRIMLDVAASPPYATWVANVVAYMEARQIPLITKSGIAESCIKAAHLDREHRKQLLRHYRWDIVNPILLKQDEITYVSCAARLIPTFGIPLSSLIPRPCRLPKEWLVASGPPGMWKYFRCWSIARLTGRWPCSVLGSADLPFTLAKCSWCDTCNITVLHPFCCPRVAWHIPQGELSAWASAMSDEQTLSVLVFGSGVDPASQWQRIQAVGTVLVEQMLEDLGQGFTAADPYFSNERLEFSECLVSEDSPDYHFSSDDDEDL